MTDILSFQYLILTPSNSHAIWLAHWLRTRYLGRKKFPEPIPSISTSREAIIFTNFTKLMYKTICHSYMSKFKRSLYMFSPPASCETDVEKKWGQLCKCVRNQVSRIFDNTTNNCELYLTAIDTTLNFNEDMCADGSYIPKQEWCEHYWISVLDEYKLPHMNYLINQGKCSFIECEDEIDQNTKIETYFEETYQLILKKWRDHISVIVHCGEGISRSSTIVIAFIIRLWSCSLQEAYNYVSSKRLIINPNWGFLISLAKYATRIKKQRTKIFCDLGLDPVINYIDYYLD